MSAQSRHAAAAERLLAESDDWDVASSERADMIARAQVLARKLTLLDTAVAPSPEPEYLTVDEVAAMIRAKPSTVRTWRARGEGPKVSKISGRVLFARADVEEWIRTWQR